MLRSRSGIRLPGQKSKAASKPSNSLRRTYSEPFLHIPVERHTDLGIGELVPTVFVFGRDLLQSVTRLVVGVGRSGSVGIECHYALRFGLDALVLGLGGFGLKPVIASIERRERRPAPDELPLFGENRSERPADLAPP